MDRRKFLTTAGVGAAATALAAPSIARAQESPEIKWRMTTSWPKSLDTLFGGAVHVAERVAAATNNKFQISVFAGGEILPALQVLDGVQSGTVEMGHTASYYYFGKDPTFALDCAVPFGLTARQQNAWMYFGGGMELLRDFFKQFNVYQMPAGNTGTQMGGWFRKEIKTVADLKGLKFRIGGFGGLVLARLGTVPTSIPGSDIYPSLEKGTIDAAEWVGPYDDEKLGFNKVAKYYYYPGFWEAGPQLSAYVNIKAWESLPKHYQAILESACADANVWMMAKYDAQNEPALRRLIASGTQMRPFSREILTAAWKAAHEIYDELAEKNPNWKKIYGPWRKFRDEDYLWFRYAENTYANFAFSAPETIKTK